MCPSVPSFVQLLSSMFLRLLTSDALALQSETERAPYFTSGHVNEADINRQ